MPKFAKRGTKTDTYFETVATKLIEQIEKGTAPWQKPWEAGKEANAPINAKTGKPYNGMNRVWLDMNSLGSGDPRWCTYKQALDLGAQVRKGERGTQIQFWRFDKEQIKKDDSGKPVRDASGSLVKQRVQLDRPMVMTSTVFHASQMDGLPPFERSKGSLSEFERHDRCESILSNSGADIRHQRGDRAFYSPSVDAITLPERDQFKSEDAYYATALHELGHWTGHDSRLHRDLAHSFGSEGYAKEELRAEIASYMVGQDLEIGHDPGQHAAYVGSWVKVLKDDPKEIFAAARDAQKISNYVQSFDLEKSQTQQEEKETIDSSQTEKEVEPNNHEERATESEPWDEKSQSLETTFEDSLREAEQALNSDEMEAGS